MTDWETDYPDQPGDRLLSAGALLLVVAVHVMDWLVPLLRTATT